MNGQIEAEYELPPGDADHRCRCGQMIHLYWNGGELDGRTCSCGRVYSLEHRRIALVIRAGAAVSR